MSTAPRPLSNGSFLSRRRHDLDSSIVFHLFATILSPVIQIRHLLLIALATTAVGHAELPQKVPLMRYQRLWTDSPFTAKPVVDSKGTVANPLEDYVLLGVSQIGGAHRVRMMNKKKPTDPRIIVETGKPSQGFSILDVIHSSDGNMLHTMVRMQSGSQIGTIAFDEKFLKPTPPPAAPTTPNPGATPNPSNPTTTPANPSPGNTAAPSNPVGNRPRSLPASTGATKASSHPPIVNPRSSDNRGRHNR